MTPPASGTLVEWLNRLYKEKYTGRTTLHWIDGVPKKVEYPGPQQTLTPIVSSSDHKSD